MTDLHTQAHTFTVAHPKTPYGTSWENGCARLMWDFNSSFTKGWTTHGNVSTAAHAMSNSDVAYKTIAQAGVGHFVWLSLPGSAAGHVGQIVKGTGHAALAFWATDAITEVWGDFIGCSTIDYYVQRKGANFLGLSDDYAGAVPDLSQFSEVTPPSSIGNEMSAPLVYYYTAGTYWERYWEFSTEQTSSSATAALWKAEAGQTTTLDAGTAQNVTDRRNAVIARTAAFIAQIPAGGGVTVAQLNTALAALATTADLPTTEQLGQALTSTVSLVDQHVDSAFAGLVLKTN